MDVKYTIYKYVCDCVTVYSENVYVCPKYQKI